MMTMKEKKSRKYFKLYANKNLNFLEKIEIFTLNPSHIYRISGEKKDTYQYTLYVMYINVESRKLSANRHTIWNLNLEKE